MSRTHWLQERWMSKFNDLLSRSKLKRLSGYDAAKSWVVNTVSGVIAGVTGIAVYRCWSLPGGCSYAFAIADVI